MLGRAQAPNLGSPEQHDVDSIQVQIAQLGVLGAGRDGSREGSTAVVVAPRHPALGDGRKGCAPAQVVGAGAGVQVKALSPLARVEEPLIRVAAGKDLGDLRVAVRIVPSTAPTSRSDAARGTWCCWGVGSSWAPQGWRLTALLPPWAVPPGAASSSSTT